MRTSIGLAAAALVALAASAAAEVVGWRGDGSGIYPGAKPPLEWSRVSKTLRDMKCQARRPKGAPDKDAVSASRGGLFRWLVLGPFDAADPKAALDQELLPNEAGAAPDEGEKAGERAWTAATAEDTFLDLLPSFKDMTGKVAYAHSYLYSPNGGRITLDVQHGSGLKLYVNGKQVYSKPGLETGHSGANLNVALEKGWNRVLAKVTGRGADAEWTPQCFLRLRFWSAEPNEEFESRNILWAAPLPNRCASPPVIVGEGGSGDSISNSPHRLLRGPGPRFLPFAQSPVTPVSLLLNSYYTPPAPPAQDPALFSSAPRP